jgi:tetratricopeptide (TPR) repeat protein
MGKTEDKVRMILVCFAITAVTAAVFRRVHSYEFIQYDDPAYVSENKNVSGGLTLENIKWAFTTPHGGTSYWHPVTWLSHIADCELFGLDAGRHHTVNLVVHIINSLLLFVIFSRMTGALWSSGFVAALFAIHPLHVESVAWITERKDVLSTFFLLLTIGAYNSYVRRPGISRYLPVIVLFSLGLMSKPMLVTLPFILLLLDYWPLERFGKGWRQTYRLILEKVPLFILSSIVGAVTFFAQRGVGTLAGSDILSFKIRAANAFISYIKYIAKMIWPSRLAVFYPYNAERGFLWYGAASAVLLAVISILVLRAGRRHKELIVGWFWFVVMLVPVSGFVQVGVQSMADRYTYMSLTGLFIIVGWGAPEVLAGWKGRKVLLGLSGFLVILGLSAVSVIQVGYWQNSVKLFERAIEVTKDNGLMHYNLGRVLQTQGKLDEALEQYEQTMRINPDFAEAYVNTGIVLSVQGRLDEGIKFYERALQIKPDSTEAHYNIAKLYEIRSRFDEAANHYREVIRVEPEDAEAHCNLGIVLYRLGQFEDAAANIKKGVELALAAGNEELANRIRAKLEQYGQSSR